MLCNGNHDLNLIVEPHIPLLCDIPIRSSRSDPIRSGIGIESNRIDADPGYGRSDRIEYLSAPDRIESTRVDLRNLAIGSDRIGDLRSRIDVDRIGGNTGRTPWGGSQFRAA